ncbi:MAG: DUF362 domain-containing protein [Candidatus Heimdallarchaeota archaeon]|nr:DUF362 domain-containing protein [Candidatus Heimdallarchaeota archaeon]
MDTPNVYFGSLFHGQNSAAAGLGAKLDKIIEALDFSTIEKKDKVAVKMHLGFRDGYQTVPVFFVRKVVEAIKKQGAYPFVTDNPTAVYNAANRGYTSETVGCPLIPIAGVKDGYKVEQEINYHNVDTLDMAGAMHDADVLIDLTHSKGHGCNGYGGAIKNIALGAYAAQSRWRKIHGVEQSLPYWDADKCSPEHAMKLKESCPYDAINYKEEDHKLSVAFCACVQCGECLKADKEVGCLQIKQENFSLFQELLAIASKKVVDTFEKDKVFGLNFLLQITPQCDCMGMPQPVMVTDIGVLGSRDLVAVDVASLDLIKQTGMIPNSISPIFKHVNWNMDEDLHPFQRVHGPMKDPYIAMRYAETLGMGSTKYNLVEVLNANDVAKAEKLKHAYEGEPSFY